MPDASFFGSFLAGLCARAGAAEGDGPGREDVRGDPAAAEAQVGPECQKEEHHHEHKEKKNEGRARETAP